MLALHLLIGLTCQLLFTVIIGIDNQAAIRSLMNQKSKPVHYLLDKIHNATERFHQHQDQLQNKTTFQQAQHQQRQLTAKSRNVVDLQIHWILGHVRILSMSQGRGSAVPWPKTWLWLDHSGTMLWPVILDTQVPWSLHMVHYYIYYYLVLILLYSTNNQSHSINTVVCGLRISSHSLTGYKPHSALKDSASLLLLSL